MAEKKRSLVEEALLQMQNLEDVLTENTKGILSSTMKEEIKELVKESISDEDETDEMSEVKKEKSFNKKGHDEMTEQEDEIELDVEDDEMAPDMGDMDNEFEMDDSEIGDEDMTDLPDDEFDMEDEFGVEDEFEMEDDALLPLDLTQASDEEILKVYKAMGEDDGIIIRKDNDRITLTDENEDSEYEIQLESEDEVEMSDDDIEMEVSEEDEIEDFESGEVIYEIEIEDEEEEEEVEKTETKEEWGSKRDEFRRKHGRKMGDVGGHYKDYESTEGEKMTGEYKESSIRSFQNGRKLNKKPDNFPPRFKRPGVRSEAMEKVVADLREKNEEYRKALNIFKEKLNEVAVFNSNLAYATRLFMEHSTSKQEKINILKRFDSVETIKESKNLYKSLKDELDSKESPVVSESIKSKIQKPSTSGSATNIIESKTYENPQFLRMKDLMNKIQK